MPELTGNDLEGRFEFRIDHNAEPGGDVLDLLADILIDMGEQDESEQGSGTSGVAA